MQRELDLGALGARLTLAAVLCLALGGCASEDADEDSSNSTESGSSDSQDSEGGVDCTPNTGDGRTACDDLVTPQCTAGNYCRQVFGCEPGCESSLNCASGEWCDLRMAATVDGPDGDQMVGVCRPSDDPICGGGSSASTTTADTTTTAGGGPTTDDTSDTACMDVQGNYEISIRGNSPEFCDDVIEEGVTCSVAQDGCELTWGCPGLFGSALTPGPIDEDDIYTAEGSLMGAPYSCEVEFSASSFPFSFSWSCSITGPEGTIVCEGNGS